MIMITKMILSPSDNLSPAILEYSESKEDYFIDIPKGITRLELIGLVDEIKRITEYED